MKILRAFYHRSRRVFVPMLAREIAAKTRADLDTVKADLFALSQRGLVKSRKANTRDDAPSYELTPAGKMMAEQAIRAEAIARSV